MNAQVRLLEQESTINELRAALKESEAQRERLMDATQILVERAGQLHMGLAEVNAELAKANAARLEAEKEAKQLRYERQLLGLARLTLDKVAESSAISDRMLRAEAEYVAQRIVDEIGHPATDEPALGPSFHTEIKRLRELGTEILSHFHEDMPECSATRTCWVGKKQVAEWRRAFTRDETNG